MDESLLGAGSRVDPQAGQPEDRLGDDFDRRIRLDLDLQDGVACRAEGAERGRRGVEDGDDFFGGEFVGGLGGGGGEGENAAMHTRKEVRIGLNMD